MASSFPSLMQDSVDGVFGVGSEQTVTFWNRACESITGIPAAKAVGKCCHEVLKGQDANGRPLCKCDCPLRELANGGPPPDTLAMRITHSDGHRLQLCVGTMLMPSATQNEWSIVHMLRRSRGTKGAEFFACNINPTLEQADTSQTDLTPLLTQREREVLAMLAEGRDTETISNTLHISTTTVRNHIQRLMAKLNVHSRHEAVAFAHRHNLVARQIESLPVDRYNGLIGDIQ